MPFNKLYSHLNIFLINIFILMLVGCGSFNSSSLVSSDGIYSNESIKENGMSKYYENYFKDKALELQNDFVFNDSLISSNEFITSNDINYSSSNPAWGDIPNSVDYVIDYYPYRNRYLGYGYGGYYGMYPYYGYWDSGYSYHSMRNWYRYGWMSGYYPFYYNFYPYNWFGRTMPFGYRNRYSSYGAYGNSPYDNYLNRDYNNISYNNGRRGSASNVVYGNGTKTSVDKDLDKNKVTNVNSGRSYVKEIDNSNNNNVIRIRTYQDFVRSTITSKPVERNRIYSRPEGGVVKSDSSTSSNTMRDSSRRYYNNPTSSNNQTKSNWGLSGRNYNSSSSNSNNVRSYSNPSSSSQTRSSYGTTPSRSSSNSFSRPPSVSSSSSSSSSSSTSSGSSRGSR